MNEDLESKLQEFEDWLIDEMRFSQSTVKATIRKLKYVTARCDMSRDGAQDFIRRTWRSKGNKTANGYIKIVNRWLKFNKAKPMKYFKEYDSFVIKLCTYDQKKKLLKVAEATGAREAAMFYLLFGTGVRLQEACELKLQDIMDDRVVVKGKGEKTREIYLPPEAKDKINRYLEVRYPSDKEFLFTSQRGKMSYDYFRKRCEIISWKAGVKFHPHMARHTYATELLKKGISVSYVARLLGHENLSSTQVYLHPSQDDAIEEVRKIEFFLGPVSNGTGWYGPVGSWKSESIAEADLILFFGEVVE
jgi:site-specific recombinase XerD